MKLLRLTAIRIQGFIALEARPENLAVFRFTVFLALIWAGTLPSVDAVWYSGLPHQLRVPLPGWSWILPYLSISPETISPIFWMFLVSSAFAMVGLWTRLSASVAVITSLVVLGLPQFFGKVNHYHHLWWFAALLATSPCGDAWSVDSWLLRRRGRLHGSIPPSARYGAPLRFAWLLIGVIYFFPGCWKYAICGLDWALGDNLKWIMYSKWWELGGYLPAFRVDHHPLLYRSAALAVLALELLFLPLLFFRRLRPVAIIGGLGFHLSSLVFMRIKFLHLVLCYVVFFDWRALIREQRFALLGGEDRGDPEARFRDWIGRSWPVATAGALLLVSNFGLGMYKVNTWPLSVYPAFAYFQSPMQVSLAVAAVDEEGREIRLDDGELSRRFSSPRWQRLLQRAARARGEKGVPILMGLTELLVREGALQGFPSELRFYSEISGIAPEDWEKNPLRRALLLRMALRDPRGAAERPDAGPAMGDSPESPGFF